MNDPIKRIEQHEQDHAKFEREVNENMTMLLGQTWKQIELLRSLKTIVVERFDRADERITESHKDLAELEIAVKDIKATMTTRNDIGRVEDRLDIQGQRQDVMDSKLDEIAETQKKMLQMLQKQQGPG